MKFPKASGNEKSIYHLRLPQCLPHHCDPDMTPSMAQNSDGTITLDICLTGASTKKSFHLCAPFVIPTMEPEGEWRRMFCTVVVVNSFPYRVRVPSAFNVRAIA